MQGHRDLYQEEDEAVAALRRFSLARLVRVARETAEDRPVRYSVRSDSGSIHDRERILVCWHIKVFVIMFED
jgi:hypothetical protein